MGAIGCRESTGFRATGSQGCGSHRGTVGRYTEVAKPPNPIKILAFTMIASIAA